MINSKQLNDLAAQNYSVADNFFDPELISALRQELERLSGQGELKKAGIGRGTATQIVSSIRGDFIHWLSTSGETAAEKKFLQVMHDLQQSLNQEFFIGIKSLEAHYALYPPGGGYQKHVDQHAGTRARKMTFILYLNQDWHRGDGGELLIYKPENPDEILIQVEPLAGRLVLFRSEIFPHAVSPCLKPRMSLTGWFRSDQNENPV